MMTITGMRLTTGTQNYLTVGAALQFGQLSHCATL